MYVLELIVIVLAEKAGAGPVVAVGIAFWLGLITSFLLQKFVSFRDRRTQSKVLVSQIVATTALVLFNFSFTISVVAVFDTVLPAVVIRTLALGLTTLWNYYLYKTRIFNSASGTLY